MIVITKSLKLAIAYILFLLSTKYMSLTNASLSMLVPAGEEDCLTIRTPQNARSYINGNFDCLDDELKPDPIRIALYDDNFEQVWVSKEGASEGIFSHLGSGVHHFCIQNGMPGGDDMYSNSDGEDRRIGFSLRVVPLQHGNADAGDAEGPDDENTARLIEMSSGLLTWIDSLMDHQDYMRVRESVHRDLAEATFRRVIRWTLLEALVLICVSGGQVIYLKKFFEQRRYV